MKIAHEVLISGYPLFAVRRYNVSLYDLKYTLQICLQRFIEVSGEEMAGDHSGGHHTISEIGTASFLVPVRKNQSELLDQGIGSNADVRTNLMEMWRLNRYFGGVEALTRHLYPRLEQATEPMRIVDIGSGSGEMALLLATWAKQNERCIWIGALDKSERNQRVARENTMAAQGIHLIQADARELPIAAKEVDYFISSLFLHHLAPEQVIGVLRDSYNRARRGIVMSDLIRSYFPLAAFHLIQPIFARHYLTHHDGHLSIERAYTPNELRSLAQTAGLETARVYCHFPWRMTLVAEKRHV